MIKVLNLFKFELKNIVRDKMTLYMLVMPFILLAASSFIIPRTLNGNDLASAGAKYGSLITFIFLISMATFIVAALLSFVLLDRKDEKTLYTIAATPLSVGGYIKFQAMYNYILTVFMNLVVLIGTKVLASDAYSYELNGQIINMFGNLGYDKIIIFSFVSGMYMPALGLLVGAISNNKIEGFAYVKMTGFLMFIPLLLILDTFSGGMQYVLGISPNFWAIKGLMITVLPSNEADMSFAWYMIIGALYGAIINIPAYKFFIRRALRV